MVIFFRGFRGELKDIQLLCGRAAYNAIDDYIADATDAFENALTGAADLISEDTAPVAAKRGMAAG